MPKGSGECATSRLAIRAGYNISVGLPRTVKRVRRLRQQVMAGTTIATSGGAGGRGPRSVNRRASQSVGETVSQVSFTGLEGRTMDGWLEEPAGPGKYVASFGARVQNYQWPKPGPDDTTDTVSLVMKHYRDGLYNSGMETGETAEFRQVYADHARCVDVLLARDNVDPKRIVARGASRTGPSALAAAALDQRIALVDIHVPTSAGISWPTRFYGGWGAHGSSAKPADVPLEKWLRLLAYFDMVNFAPDVKCPVIIGLGLRDYGLSNSRRPIIREKRAASNASGSQS